MRPFLFVLPLALGCTVEAHAATPPDESYANLKADCAEQIELPRPTGQYAVGTSTFFFADPDRAEPLSEDAHDRRQVTFQLWYPASPDADAATVAYAPEIQLMRAGMMADRREMPQTIAENLAPYACVTTSAVRDAPVAVPAAPFPVILFSPGGNMSRHWHTAQAQEFASQGYVVAVMSHAYSGFDVFPSGGLLMSSDHWRAPDDAIAEDERRLDDELSDMLAGDASLILDRVVQIADGTIAHGLSGHVDTGRVSIVGHSRGGKTVARSCAGDDRIDACITYDNLAPDREQETGLDKPQLTIRSPWDAERVAALHAYMERNPEGAFDVAIADASHFTFSDLQIVDPEHYSHELDPRRGLALANRVTLAFLDAALNGRHPDLSVSSDALLTVWSNRGE